MSLNISFCDLHDAFESFQLCKFWCKAPMTEHSFRILNTVLHKIMYFIKSRVLEIKEQIKKKRESKKDINKSVQKILSAVSKNGDSAVINFTEKFDKVLLEPSGMRVLNLKLLMLSPLVLMMSKKHWLRLTLESPSFIKPKYRRI